MRKIFLFFGFAFLILNFAFAEDTGSINRTTKYGSGGNYSVELKNVDIKEALQFLAKVAGINMMIPDTVSGVVNTSFESTSLDDAINSIVKANGLDYAVERGIWRIGEGEKFTTSGEDLKTETFRLKYASAKDLVDKIKGLLTTRGSVLADERTNALVIRERPANIDNVWRFLSDIDVRDAQVLIEAKIVEATRDFSRSLGIQWGAVSSPGSHASFQGVNSVGAMDSASNALVNLPMQTTPSISSATSGIGMIIGQLAGGTTIDAQITAAEENGDLNIVSEPTIVTSNGVAANIKSGETMYIKTTNSGTTSSSSDLQSVETGIELNVTPQISVDNYIKLNISTETSQLDFTRTVDGMPVKTGSQASTSVVIKDGETTIIGGLAKLTGSKTSKNVPGFSKIPLLGMLFKSKAKYKQNMELMIFIKPTIIKSVDQIPQNAKYGKVEEMREGLVIAPPEDKKSKIKPAQVSDKARSRNKYLKDR